MKFILKPSLERMALIKIVVSLWNHIDVRGLIMKINSRSLFTTVVEHWRKIEKKVTEQVPLLSLPQLLKEKVLGFIKPIGLEISMWIRDHKHFNVNLPPEFCWTPQGTVDRKRTAEVLLRDENLDVSTRYKLACFYCLEDDINQFWNRLSEDLKEYDWHNFPVMHYWSDNMKRGGAGHISYKDLFYASVLSCNKVAAKYFLQKITPWEREESLVKATKDLQDEDTLYFLISEMSEEQQMAVFKNSLSTSYRVLRSFLKWPLHSFFIETANCMHDFLSKNAYNCLLIDIVHKVEQGYNDWNYQELFRESWQKSPNALKIFITDMIDKSSLLPALFRIKHKGNIRLILKDANLTAKEKLICSDTGNAFCERSIHDNEWDFLDFFIRDCLSSKNAMLKFKEEFEKRMYFKECSSSKKLQWNQLLCFSEDSISKYGKRSIKEGESSSSKRFRSLE